MSVFLVAQIPSQLLERLREVHLSRLDVSYHLMKHLHRLAKLRPPNTPPPAARLLDVLLLLTPPARDVDPKQANQYTAHPRSSHVL